MTTEVAGDLAGHLACLGRVEEVLQWLDDG